MQIFLCHKHELDLNTKLCMMKNMTNHRKEHHRHEQIHEHYSVAEHEHRFEQSMNVNMNIMRMDAIRTAC